MGWCSHRGGANAQTHHSQPLNLVSLGQNTTLHMVCWHCCDSQRYRRQSIIFINASCANEHLQKSLDFFLFFFWQGEKISFIACRTNSVYKSEGSTIAASFTAPFVQAFDVH